MRSRGSCWWSRCSLGSVILRVGEVWVVMLPGVAVEFVGNLPWVFGGCIGRIKWGNMSV